MLVFNCSKTKTRAIYWHSLCAFFFGNWHEGYTHMLLLRPKKEYAIFVRNSPSIYFYCDSSEHERLRLATLPILVFCSVIITRFTPKPQKRDASTRCSTHKQMLPCLGWFDAFTSSHLFGLFNDLFGFWTRVRFTINHCPWLAQNCHKQTEGGNPVPATKVLEHHFLRHIVAKRVHYSPTCGPLK